ncbi:hypothetical protein BC827DRAFT_1154555 [Russula dissimulans]|nr:hypothetical protein BC827DRAFT_1154555 [Russula dissimulans]
MTTLRPTVEPWLGVPAPSAFKCRSQACHSVRSLVSQAIGLMSSRPSIRSLSMEPALLLMILGPPGPQAVVPLLEEADRCFPSSQTVDVLAFFTAETISVLDYEMSPYLICAGGLDTTEGAPGRNPVFISDVAFQVLASFVTPIAIDVGAFFRTCPTVPWTLDIRYFRALLRYSKFYGIGDGVQMGLEQRHRVGDWHVWEWLRRSVWAMELLINEWIGVVELDFVHLGERRGHPLSGRVVRNGSGWQGIGSVLVRDMPSQQDCNTFTAFPYLAWSRTIPKQGSYEQLLLESALSVIA